jgi:hypothetical protein
MNLNFYLAKSIVLGQIKFCNLHLRHGSAKRLPEARNVDKIGEKLEIQYSHTFCFLIW